MCKINFDRYLEYLSTNPFQSISWTLANRTRHNWFNLEIKIKEKFNLVPISNKNKSSKVFVFWVTKKHTVVLNIKLNVFIKLKQMVRRQVKTFLKYFYMAFTSPSCSSSIYLSYYLYLKKLNMERVSIKIYPVRDPPLVLLGVKTINFLF